VAEERHRGAAPLDLRPEHDGLLLRSSRSGVELYLRFLRTPWAVLAVFALIGVFGVWLSRRTVWSPHEPFPVDERRSGGQIYRAAFRLYRRYRWLFLGIGLIFLPLAGVAMLLQELIARFTGFGTFLDLVENDAIVSGVAALALGQLSTILGSIAVTGAVAHALSRIQERDEPDALEAYRGMFPRADSLGWAWFRVIVVAGLLVVTIVGIPIAVIYLVRKSVITQACVIEDLHASAALRRSNELVRRHGPRVFAITALVNVTAYLLGPIVGILVLFLTSSSLEFVNLVSSLVYVFVMPYAGIALALLFYDLRRRFSVQASLVSAVQT
jgi:hypothetical protein